jgi:hypothetical protein
MRIFRGFPILCALYAVSGCVSQSTFNAVVQDGQMTKAEIDRIQEDYKILVREANDLERMNADSMREAETIVAAVQQAKDDAEDERQAAELRITRLKGKLALAAKQYNALQYELKMAKENTGALQEMIEVYQRKLRDGASPRPEPTVHKPFDPSTIPAPQELPAPPAVEPPKPVPPPTPSPALPASPAKRTPDPVDAGWFDSIKDWLVSLWRAVFS